MYVDANPNWWQSVEDNFLRNQTSNLPIDQSYRDLANILGITMTHYIQSTRGAYGVQLALGIKNAGSQYRFSQYVISSDQGAFWDGESEYSFYTDEEETELLTHRRTEYNYFYGQNFDGGLFDEPHRGLTERTSLYFSWQATLFIFQNNALVGVVNYGFTVVNGVFNATPLQGYQ